MRASEPAEIRAAWQSLTDNVFLNPYPPISDRLTHLLNLEKNILASEQALLEAMRADFSKPMFEGYFAEIDQVLREIRSLRQNLKNWAKKQYKEVPITLFPSNAYTQYLPRGLILMISPWNYPCYLSLMPIVGALAAGNRFILKPSELTPNTSQVLAELIQNTLPKDMAFVALGGPETARDLLQLRWDLICFTGSTRVGQIVYEHAAKNLTPVLLELGGKSPAVIFPGASLASAAKRIIWGKGINAGQTCVAPDLLFVPKKNLEEVIHYLKVEIKSQWQQGNGADTTSIINDTHFQRLRNLIEENRSHLVAGGETDGSLRKIALTLLVNPPVESSILQEEIFGPILPIISYDSENELLTMLRRHCHESLAAYFFGNDEERLENLMLRLKFGGGCINDTLIHLSTKETPFGGIGRSGIGSYHGFHSFKTFSHERSIAVSGQIEIPLRYPPYQNKFRLLKKILSILKV